MFGSRFWLAVVIALLPAVVLGVVLTRGSVLAYLMVLVWLVAVGGALYRIRRVRCPRCGKTFSVEGWWSPSARKCVHCGLELDAG